MSNTESINSPDLQTIKNAYRDDAIISGADPNIGTKNAVRRYRKNQFETRKPVDHTFADLKENWTLIADAEKVDSFGKFIERIPILLRAITAEQTES